MSSRSRGWSTPKASPMPGWRGRVRPLDSSVGACLPLPCSPLLPTSLTQRPGGQAGQGPALRMRAAGAAAKVNPTCSHRSRRAVEHVRATACKGWMWQERLCLKGSQSLPEQSPEQLGLVGFQALWSVSLGYTKHPCWQRWGVGCLESTCPLVRFLLLLCPHCMPVNSGYAAALPLFPAASTHSSLAFPFWEGHYQPERRSFPSLPRGCYLYTGSFKGAVGPRHRGLIFWGIKRLCPWCLRWHSFGSKLLRNPVRCLERLTFFFFLIHICWLRKVGGQVTHPRSHSWKSGMKKCKPRYPEPWVHTWEDRLTRAPPSPYPACQLPEWDAQAARCRPVPSQAAPRPGIGKHREANTEGVHINQKEKPHWNNRATLKSTKHREN